MELTIAYSPCPNDTFIFDALIHGRVRGPKVHWKPVLDDVETLNEWALEGRHPVTKLSYHAYAHCFDKYQLLDAGSALGNGCGPILITRHDLIQRPVEEMTIAIPGLYTTAHFLFMLAYPQASQKTFMNFASIEQAVLNGDCDAGVIIHENRFTYRQKGLVAIRDLGAHWEETSGHPIPLGGIAVRRDLDHQLKTDIERGIHDSVRHAWTHPGDSRPYVQSHASEMDPEVQRQHIELYVNDWSASLGLSGKAAVEAMYAHAFALNIIPQKPEDIFL